MARRAQNVDLPAVSPRTASRVVRVLRIGLTLLILASVLVGCVWAAVRVEQFVVTDKQFLLQGPLEPGRASETFEIIGLKHAPEQRVVDVFAGDFGRSTYLCPIQERRRKLLAVNWIEEASVSRVWPNRIVVHIIERVPVAFVQTPGLDGAMFYKLVDSDGVLLDPRHAGELALPVLAGFPVKGNQQIRRERMRRFLRLQTELGPLMDRISEIDVSEPDNLKITQDFDGRAFTLMVGDQKYLQRYQSFLDNYAEIRSRLPEAVMFDLRLQDRITAVGLADRAQGVRASKGREVSR